LEERGDYLLYLVDQDDVWMPNRIDIIKSYFNKTKIIQFR
jgi:hypothetical protein